MAKFRKKPVIIDAELFHWGMEDGIIRWDSYIPKDADKYPTLMKSRKYEGYLSRYNEYNDRRGFENGDWQPYIETLEGKMRVSKGDFIITGIQGERYPCKSEIFEKTYEPVEI